MTQRKKALLLGNGINRVIPKNAVSWGQLLEQLKKGFDIQVELDNPFKPFPLAFDEMLHRKSGLNELDDKLKRLKKYIRLAFEELSKSRQGYNLFHRQLIDQQYTDILTTNYDYSLQLSVLGQDFFVQKQKLAENRIERMHSLKRRYRLPNRETRVWHIHGELFDSRTISPNYEGPDYNERSILIGYEQYADYLERIQENFSGDRNSDTWEKDSMVSRITNPKEDRVFWTDILFTHDLDIVGLGFEFSESHLWWLMKQRAKLIRGNSNVRISNTVRFFYADIQEETAYLEFLSVDRKGLKKIDSVRKSKAVAEVLSAFEVNAVPIPCRSHLEFYENLLVYLNREVNS